jgi:hypothetical protein
MTYNQGSGPEDEGEQIIRRPWRGQACGRATSWLRVRCRCAAAALRALLCYAKFYTGQLRCAMRFFCLTHVLKYLSTKQRSNRTALFVPQLLQSR